MAVSPRIREWLLPPGVRRWLRQREIRRRIRRPLTSEEAAILSRNARFRDLHAGRRCFILGNGPSLANVDLAPFGGEITIVMNSFNRHPILKQWQPTFYCRAEPPGSYDSPERVRTLGERVAGIAAQAYFLPFGVHTIVRRHGTLPEEKAYYFKPVADLTEWPAEQYPIEMTGPMPHAGSTAHLAIMLAIYMGCSPIIMLGMDYDFLAHRSVNRHFYGAPAEEAGGPDDLGTYPYASLMEHYLREWRQFETLRRLAERRGLVILNATEGSFLDVFPFVRIGTEGATPPRRN